MPKYTAPDVTYFQMGIDSNRKNTDIEIVTENSDKNGKYCARSDVNFSTIPHPLLGSN